MRKLRARRLVSRSIHRTKMLKPLATFYGCALLQTCTPTTAFELDKKDSKTRTKVRTPNPITSDLASGLGRKMPTETALLQKEDGARILKVVHFVDKHAPVRDRAQLSTSYKLENARLALAAYDRVVAKWGRSFYTGMNASTSEASSALLRTETTPEEGATSFLQEFEAAAQDAVVDEQLPFLFLNDVAPYAVFSERRTEWRQWFFESLTEAVFGGSNSNLTATELINLVNSDLVWNNSNTNRSLNLCANISPPQDLPDLGFSLLNTARADPADDEKREAAANTKKECSGPIVFIPSGYDGINNYDVFDFLNGTNTDGVTGSSCTGQAVFMVALFRTLGIPARAAGVPHWKKGAEECPLGDASEGCGNHNWVEVWDGSEWHFLSPQPQEQGTETGGTEDVAKEEEQGSGGTLLQLRGRLDSRRRKKEMKARSRRTRTNRADDEEVEVEEGAGTLDEGWFFPEPVGQAVPCWIQENSSNLTGSDGSNMTTTNASNASAMNATSTATSSGKGNHSVYATSWMNTTHFGLGVSSWAEIADMLHNGLKAPSNRTANKTSSAAVEANSTSEDESGLTFITTLFETTNTAEEYSEDASLEDDGGGLRIDVEGKPAGSAADVATDLGNDTFAHPTGFFPIVWADGDQEVSAWDVTCRYLPPEKQEEYAC